MPTLGSQWKMLGAGLLFAVFVFASASWYVYAKEKSFTSVLRTQLNAEQTTLIELAKASSQDGLDSDLSKIVTNCNSEDQSEFDTLLGSLGQLRGAELKHVQQLFYTCALIYPEQRQLMAERISRELRQYEQLSELLSIIERKAAITEYPTDLWKQVSDMETKRGELARQLVNVQGQIIAALVSGKGASSPDVQQMVVDGQQVRESLSSTLTQENDLLKNKLGL